MEIIKISISKELFEKLFKAGHIKSGEYELDKVYDSDFDYSDSEQWQELKRESTKIYKKLKNFEYDLRHNK